MKAIVNFNAADVLILTEISQINRIYDQWIYEDNSYYATPAGYKVNQQTGLMCGYNKMLSHALSDYVLAHFNININDFEGFGAWVTSRGNFTGIGYLGNKVSVLINGARHGVRTPFSELMNQSTFTYLETALPLNAHPYLTRDQFASISLDSALMCKHLFSTSLFDYEKILMSHNAQIHFFVSEGQLIAHYLKEDLSNDAPARELLAHLFIRGLRQKYLNLLEDSV
ncbi:hypothetical protein V8687_23520 (plasmid) [Shewanella baltica]|uniref:hypothetical protein n=1 Tax=Shewanella baltica TaxID=62322 RepID=UPI0030CCFF7F